MKTCALFLLLLLMPVKAEEVQLFIVHTNDMHGHLEALSGDEPTGGFVRVAAVIRAMKAAFPGHVVVLDAGDMALGTPTSGLFFGMPTAESMKSVGYDAVAIGNHEFNWGQPAMAKMLQAVGAPVLSANLVNESDGRYPYAPSTVVEKAGVRLGIIGLVAPDTPTRTPKAYTQGWVFEPVGPAAKKALADLPEVDAVIALTHIGVEADIELADTVPGIDLIVGGHSHTDLQELLVENSVPIVQAGCYCHFLGVLKVVVDTDANSLKVVSYHLIPIDETIAPDPQVSAIVEGYAAQVRPILARVVGQASTSIPNTHETNTLDSPLGDLIADMLKSQTGTDLALYNRGGVRGHMAAGPVAVEELHQMFPFDDAVVSLEVNASQLQAIVEQGAQSRANLSVSDSLRVSFDKASGKATITLDGQPLRADQTYTVTTTNFLATGGDGMSTLAELEVKKIYPYTREVVQSYIEAHPSLNPPKADRVKVITGPP